MKTILYVEDEVSSLRVLSRMLRAEKDSKTGELLYEVLEAADGAEGLRVCQTHNGPIHLLLVDYNMPPMNGPQFVAQARGYRPNAKVLYYTGFVLIDSPENHVMKDGNYDALLAAIARKLIAV